MPKVYPNSSSLSPASNNKCIACGEHKPPSEFHLAESGILMFCMSCSLTRKNTQEKRSAINLALSHHPELSDNAIAKHCGVDNKTVGSFRAEAVGETAGTPFRRTMKGHVINTTRIGKAKSSPLKHESALLMRPDVRKVYFLGSATHKMVKIGIAFNIPKRIKVLQTGCPFEIEVLGFIEGGTAKESELHKHFSTYRLHGEWFRIEGELEKYLDEISKTE